MRPARTSAARRRPRADRCRRRRACTSASSSSSARCRPTGSASARALAVEVSSSRAPRAGYVAQVSVTLRVRQPAGRDQLSRLVHASASTSTRTSCPAARRAGTTGAIRRRRESARRSQRVFRVAATIPSSRTPISCTARPRNGHPASNSHDKRHAVACSRVDGPRLVDAHGRAERCAPSLRGHPMQAPVPEESTAIDAPRPWRHRVRAPGERIGEVRARRRRAAQERQPRVRRRGSRAGAGARRPPAGRLRACGHATVR